MKKLLLLISFGMMLSTPFSQGQGMGGPPNPPPGYCEQFPNDPACANHVAVPIGSTEGMIIFTLLAGTFFMYKMNGNSFKLKKS